MKYLFINTVADFGSTGKLIVSACEALQRQGHTCYIAYGRKGAACQIPTVAIGSTRDYLIHALGHRLFGTGGFGSKSATRAFLQWVRGYDPDVIWLHNLHGYYIHIGLLFDYLRQSGKEIRWTLHDCWAFTGNCPYFSMAQCEKWKHGCGSCPQKGVYPKALLDATAENYRKKKALFTGIPNLTLQVPSRWLAELVRESFLKDYPIEVVPNTVDRAVFKPTPGSFRESHHLDGKFLVLGAASVWEPRKGLADFVALRALLPEHFAIVLIGLTDRQRAQLPPGILGLPRTKNQQELAMAYTAADVYVCPSAEETFGMTVLEAACCGTTPIVYERTACQEVAEDCGGICVPKGAENLAQAIARLQAKEAL